MRPLSIPRWTMEMKSSAGSTYSPAAAVILPQRIWKMLIQPETTDGDGLGGVRPGEDERVEELVPGEEENEDSGHCDSREGEGHDHAQHRRCA